MSIRFARASVVSSLIACASVLGPVTGAQASNATLRATVKDDLPTITRSQAEILNGIATYRQTHSSSALIKAIKAQNRDLRALQARLSGKSPSSPKGARAKTDLETGLGLIVSSNNLLAKALKKSAKGKFVSKSLIKAVVTSAEKGNADLNTGAKLLKV